MKKWMIFFAVLGISSCTEKSKESITGTLLLKELRQFKIERPIESNGLMTTYAYSAELDQLFLSNFTNFLYLFDLKNEAFISKIELNDFEIPYAYTFRINEGRDLIINSVRPTSIVKYSLEHEKLEKTNLATNYLLDTDDNRNPSFSWKNQWISHLSVGGIFRSQDKSFPTFAAFSIDGSLLSYFGTYPEYITKLSGEQYASVFAEPISVVFGDRLYVSYPLDEKIYVYDLNTRKLKLAKDASSQYFKMPQPFELGNREKDLQQMLSSSFYGAFSYHSEKKIFSRVVVHAKGAEYADKKFISDCLRSFSLLIFDEDMNSLGEIKLDDFKFNWKSPIATPRGFIVAEVCGTSLGDDFLSFTHELEIRL
jgi:hypothetical protein